MSIECRYLVRSHAACANYHRSLKWFVYKNNRDSLTSTKRLTSWSLSIYSMAFPVGSQGLMMQSGNDVPNAPRNGTTFSCSTYFRRIISRYNRYRLLSDYVHHLVGTLSHTRLILSRFFTVCARNISKHVPFSSSCGTTPDRKCNFRRILCAGET